MFLFLIIILLDFNYFQMFCFLEFIKLSNTLCVINIFKRKFGFWCDFFPLFLD